MYKFSEQNKLWALSIFLMMFGLLGGAIDHTIHGTWGMVAPAGILTYLLSAGVAAGTAVVVGSKWALAHEERRSRRVTEFAYNRVQHHLDAKTPRDKYGFLAMLDWAEVVDLEHILGFPHIEESNPYCQRTTCWEEYQDPIYGEHNGYIVIESFPKLPREKVMSNRLKNEFEARKARGTGYIPASITVNEARDLGYPEAQIKKETASNKFATLIELRALPLEEKFKNDNQWHHEEYESIRPAIEAYRDRREPLMLPEGYMVEAHDIPGLLQVRSPTGLSVIVETPSVSDRRRDDEAFWSIP